MPRGGIEPPTQGFSVLRSTDELPRQKKMVFYIILWWKLYYFIHIIISWGFIFFCKTAFLAPASNAVFIFYNLYAHGLHHTVAFGCPIAGIYVNMFWPKASWAMIGIAGSFNFFSAMLAGKVFNIFLEFFFSHAIYSGGRLRNRTWDLVIISDAL